MLTLKSQGVPLRTIIEDFIKEFEISEQALYKDWRQRNKWARDIAQIKDPALLDELIQGLKQIIPNAWYEYKTNPNPSVKLGALKLAQQTYVVLVEILQSMGIVEKIPEEMHITLMEDEYAGTRTTINISPTQGAKPVSSEQSQK